MSTSEIAKLESRWRENPKGLTFAPLAEAYRKQKEPERALEILGPGLERHPDYIPANIVLGRCHWDLNDLAAAERAFAHVLDLDAENVIALKAMADITERLLRYDEAERWLESLLAVDRSNDEAREQLARVRQLQSDQDQAPAASPEAVEPLAAAEDGPLAAGTGATAPAEPFAVEHVELAEHGAEDAAGVARLEGMEPTASESAGADQAAAAAGSVLEPVPPLEWISRVDSFEPTAAEPESLITEDGLAATEEGLAADAGSGDVAWSTEQGGTLEGLGFERRDEIVLEASGSGEFQTASAAEELMRTLGSGFHPEVDADAGLDDGADPAGAASEPEPHAGEEWAPPSGAPDPAGGAFAIGAAEERVNDARSVEARASDGVASGWGGSAMDVTEEPAYGEPANEPLPYERPEYELRMEPATGSRESEPLPSDAFRADASEPDVSSEPADPASVPEPDLVVTETMAEVYLRQGHVSDALVVYRALARRKPGDLTLTSRISELERREAEAAPQRPAYAARDTGGQSVGEFFGAVLAARLPPIASPRWTAPAPDAAVGGDGAPGGRGPGERPAEGAPTRPAGDPLSLGSVFGDEPPPVSPAVPTPSEPQPRRGGSFDEFFRGDSTPPAPPPRPTAASRPASEDDLDQFHAWLQSLKR